ncbi:MAG: asparagine synthase [Thaumarchaeota archaeon]|nr:asparagine synthase [Nitrososphaerota archaeon]
MIGNEPWLVDILTLRYAPNSKITLPSIKISDITSSPQDVQKIVEKKIKANIVRFIDSRKPRRISLALSGGVDSMLALVLIRELFPDLKIQCISFGFTPEDPDILAASVAAQKYNADFESFLLDNFYSNLPKQISIVGEPKTNYYWYSVAEKAKQYSDILVTGDGGDELFAGYTFRYKAYLEAFRPECTWLDRVKLYLNCHNRDWVDDQDEMFGPAINFSWNSIYENLRQFFDNSLQPLQQVCIADYHGKLARDWVPAHEKIYSALGMSGFSPFLNNDLIRHSFTIPMTEKYSSMLNVGKITLRKILHDKNCSVDVGKRGFTPNLMMFWNNHGKGFVTQFLLDDSRVITGGLISKKWVQRALETVDKRHDIRYMNKLLHIVGFEVWYRLFVSKDMSPSTTL